MIVKLEDCPEEITRHGNPKQVLLGSGIIPDVTQVAVAWFPECVETDLHAHPTMYEVFYVLEGRATYTLGPETFEVGPGALIVVPPGVTHNQKVTEAPHRVFYWGVATGD